MSATVMKHQGTLYASLAEIDNDRIMQSDGLSVLRRLQKSLDWQTSDIGKYVCAVSTETTNYFLTPDKSVWCNGLDDQKNLCEAVQVFSSEQDAIAKLCELGHLNDPEYISLSVYRLTQMDCDVVAKESLRVAFSYGKGLGPVLYKEQSLSFNPVQCIQEALSARIAIARKARGHRTMKRS